MAAACVIDNISKNQLTVSDGDAVASVALPIVSSASILLKHSESDKEVLTTGYPPKNNHQTKTDIMHRNSDRRFFFFRSLKKL